MLRGTDMLAPRYLLKVEGVKLGADVTRYVQEVTFEEEEDAASKITLVLANEEMRFLDTQLFAEGNKVDLWGGYVGRELAFMQRGVIVRPDPDFPRGGMPTMTVVAHDASRRLMDVPDDDKGKTYRNMRDSEIAESIFRDVGVGAFTIQTKGLQTRTRKLGTTRWEFLRDLAYRNDYRVHVQYDPVDKLDVGYFGPVWSRRNRRTAADATDDQEFVLVYGSGEADSTLLEFHPRSSLEGQQVKVKMIFTTAKSRKTREVEVNVSKYAQRAKVEKARFASAISYAKVDEPLPTGPMVRFTVFGQRMDVLPPRRFASPKEARHFAAAWFRSMEEEFVLGEGVAIGIERLRRGQIHRLKGVGKRLSGRWRIVSTRHRWAGTSAYEVGFHARRVPTQAVVTPGEDANATVTEVEQ